MTNLEAYFSEELDWGRGIHLRCHRLGRSEQQLFQLGCVHRLRPRSRDL